LNKKIFSTLLFNSSVLCFMTEYLSTTKKKKKKGGPVPPLKLHIQSIYPNVIKCLTQLRFLTTHHNHQICTPHTSKLQSHTCFAPSHSILIKIIYFDFKRKGSRHHNFYGKLWETKENKDKVGLRRTGLRVRESVTREEGISPPRRPS